MHSLLGSPGGWTVVDTSGTSSANTTAKPLGETYINTRKRNWLDSRLQVPIDVAVEEPRARVVSPEPERNIIGRGAGAYDVAHDGVVEVVRRVARAADDAECMSMQVDRVLLKMQELCDQRSYP